MQAHITTVHPMADIERYKELYTLEPHERAGMKALYNAKPRVLKQKKLPDIKISEAHSSRRAKR